MICRLFVLLSLSTLLACSDSPKQASTEEYPEFEEGEKSPATTEVELQLKNTATFHTVEIKQMKFVPEVLEVNAGDTVLWINKDITDHDVTEETSKTWTSSKLTMGQQCKRLFRKVTTTIALSMWS